MDLSDRGKNIQNMGVPSSEDDTTSSEESVAATLLCDTGYDGGSSATSAASSSIGSKILRRSPRNWYQVYFIRMDRSRCFRMYPDLGGPFQSVDEADCAINRHLDELRHRAMSKEHAKLSNVERRMHEYYFYPDGTPKRGPEAKRWNSTRLREEHYFVQALLDQYNEDHHLYEDLAHELDTLVNDSWIYDENETWFYHFNFTTKTKAGPVNLFFAEVSCMQGEDDWDVKCCCIISSNDNGHCYGCINYGSPDMKHPNDTSAYTGGHSDGHLPFGDDDLSGSDEDVEAGAARVRAIYEELEDLDVLEEIYRLANTPT